MKYLSHCTERSKITPLRITSNYYDRYMRLYNDCFFDLRKSLDIKPYNFLQDCSWIERNKDVIYLLIQGDEIIGSISTRGKEIDDLIVDKKHRRKGYGRKLLIWAMNRIQKDGTTISLHVAAQNKNAIELYKKTGFIITKIETIERGNEANIN